MSLKNEHVSKYDKKQITGTVLKMAIPAIIETLFITLAGFIDSLMVSTLGASSVAAVGLTTQPKFIGLAVFMALGVALSALVARRFGQQNRKDANGVFSTSFVLVLSLVAIISTTFVVFASNIIEWCGSTLETHADAVTYFRIIMGGIFFNCVQITINAAQRGAGNTKITMRTNVASNTVNVVFNYILINGKLGFPSMGIRGAAIATVLGSFVACVMSILSVCKNDVFISVPYIFNNKILPGLKYLRDIIKVGYSVFFEQILLRIGFVLTALMAADQGTDAMAAHQVGMNILSLSFAFGDGLQVAAVALIGRSLGENNPELAKKYGARCQFIGGIISVAVALVFFLGAELVMGMFFDEAHIIDIGVNIMRIIIVVTLFQIRQVIYMGCLRGAGDTLYTAVVSMIGVTIVRTVFSYLCCYIFGWGIEGVWVGVFADQAIRFVFASLRFRSGKWVHIKI